MQTFMFRVASRLPTYFVSMNATSTTSALDPKKLIQVLSQMSVSKSGAYYCFGCLNLASSLLAKGAYCIKFALQARQSFGSELIFAD